MEVSVRTSSLLQYSCMKPKILDSGERLRTLQKQHQQQAYLLPEYFDGNPSSHIRLLCVFLFCLDTNSSHAHDRQCAPHQLQTKGGGDEWEARVGSTRWRDAPDAQALIQTHFNYLCRLYF